jgi:hypothetical protein
MKKRLALPSWRTLAILGIILFFTIHTFASVGNDPGNPQEIAEVIPKVSIEEASRKALDWAAAREPSIDGWRAAAVVDSDELWAGYIQKNDYTAVYLDKYDDQYPTDFYLVDVYDAAGTARYVLKLHPSSGHVFSWQAVDMIRDWNPQLIGKDSRTAWELTAWEELGKAGMNAADYELLTGTAPAEFVFQHKTEKLGQASEQLAVTIMEGKLTGWQERFQVPASHVNWQELQNEKAGRMGLVSLALTVVISAAAIVYSIRNRRYVSFRRGVFLSIVLLLLNGITSLNMLPAIRTLTGDLPNEALMSGYLIFQLAQAAVTAVLVYFTLVSGEGMLRSEGLSLWPDRGYDVFHSMKLGYLVCAFLLGVQAFLFFVAEYQFDTWAISDPMMSVFNMKWPWLFPVLAWVAAISEEAIYRLFGIMLFRKMLRNTFLSVLFPSMIWALGHTAYPIYPAYTRFVEVTILGIIFGYVFLRHGFITVIFAHASMNSILMGLTLMLSMQDIPSVSAGIAAVLSPLFVAWVVRHWHRIRMKRHS